MNFKELPILCLTLPNQHSRQKMVKQEFLKIGIKQFEFFPGYDANHKFVRQAFTDKRVKSFPECFRCGQTDCGNDACNNILIPSQVAVVLGFQALMKRISQGNKELVLICEDDIVFAGYANHVLLDKKIQSLLKNAISEPHIPFLIRLGSPKCPDHFSHDIIPHEIIISKDVIMSNYGFIVNKSFAKIAAKRLDRIDHTADVIIHKNVAKNANAFTIRPQIIRDRSWSTGECESLIHPKNNHLNQLILQYGSNSKVVHDTRKHIKNHMKKARVVDYAFIGSPRCGSYYVSKFLKQNGIQVEHEALGRDGLCAWQYTIENNDHPYIKDIRCRDSYFVYPKRYLIYARDPQDAVAELVLENEQEPLSYSHRRNMIRELTGIDLEDFKSREERAARAYIHWYELALRRPLHGIVRVEYLFEDLRKIPGFETIHNISVSEKSSCDRNAYPEFIDDRLRLQPDWYLQLSRDTFLRLNMMAMQFGYECFNISLFTTPTNEVAL